MDTCQKLRFAGTQCDNHRTARECEAKWPWTRTENHDNQHRKDQDDHDNDHNHHHNNNADTDTNNSDSGRILASGARCPGFNSPSDPAPLGPATVSWVLHLAPEAALLRAVRGTSSRRESAPQVSPQGVVGLVTGILRRTMLAMSTAAVVTVELLDILFWQIFGALLLVPASVPWRLSGFTADGDRQDTEPQAPAGGGHEVQTLFVDGRCWGGAAATVAGRRQQGGDRDGQQGAGGRRDRRCWQPRLRPLHRSCRRRQQGRAR